MTPIVINGVSFEPHPDIGFLSDENGVALPPDQLKPTCYKFNYINIAKRIAEKEWPEIDTYRQLIKDDLWFILYFIVKPFSDDSGRELVNHPFIVGSCQEVENGPKDFTLDVWAREHYKTSILIAEVIQHQLTFPEHSTGIFSYVAPKAKKVLRSIRSILEREKLLHSTFPDVLYPDPQKEASLWSIDEGLTNKRKTNRQEPSIGAYGLTEGMPTGLHFEFRVYDDITTEDIAESYGIMESIKLKFDSSQNIGKEGGRHRVWGTYYNHMDPLIYIRDKKRIDDLGNEIPAYYLRLKPATHNGLANGRPVLISQKRLDDMKITQSFNVQQLLNPTPQEDQRLNPDFLQPIDRKFMPKRVQRFMVIDQAGDEPSNKRTTSDPDSWAIAVFAVEPFVDSIGQSKVIWDDLWISPASESEAIDQIVRMFLRGGIIQKLGVEKVGLSTTHIHIAKALKAKGRYISFGELNEGKNGVLLRPAGRHKKKVIEGALSWPLNNSKLFYCTDIPTPYIDRLKQEMSNHPLWHDDALNTGSYLYDILQNSHFASEENQDQTRQLRLAACPI